MYFIAEYCLTEENPYRPSYELPSKFREEKVTSPSGKSDVQSTKRMFEEKREQQYSGNPKAKHGKNC